MKEDEKYTTIKVPVNNYMSMYGLSSMSGHIKVTLIYVKSTKTQKCAVDLLSTSKAITWERIIQTCYPPLFEQCQMWQYSVPIYPHAEFHEVQYKYRRNVYYGSGIGEGKGIVEQVLCHAFDVIGTTLVVGFPKQKGIHISKLIRKIMRVGPIYVTTFSLVWDARISSSSSKIFNMRYIQLECVVR